MAEELVGKQINAGTIRDRIGALLALENEGDILAVDPNDASEAWVSNVTWVGDSSVRVTATDSSSYDVTVIPAHEVPAHECEFKAFRTVSNPGCRCGKGRECWYVEFYCETCGVGENDWKGVLNGRPEGSSEVSTTEEISD
jgi:hypothetical protein